MYYGLEHTCTITYMYVHIKDFSETMATNVNLVISVLGSEEEDAILVLSESENEGYDVINSESESEGEDAILVVLESESEG